MTYRNRNSHGPSRRDRPSQSRLGVRCSRSEAGGEPRANSRILSIRDRGPSRLPGTLHGTFQTGDPTGDSQLPCVIRLMESERAQQMAAAGGPTEWMWNLVCHLIIAQIGSAH